MHAIGEYVGAQRNLDGDLVISFAVDDETLLEGLEKDKGKELVIDTKRYSEKRSLNANAYFWKLCDEISKVLNTTKDAVYMLQLNKYGVFVDVEVAVEDAVAYLRDKFRYIEEYYDGLDRYIARCYFGSSHYNKAEMSRLIDGTVQDAHDLGIDTWTQAEIDNLIKNWKGEK